MLRLIAVVAVQLGGGQIDQHANFGSAISATNAGQACLAPTLMEALKPLEDESHGWTEEVPEELRERAIRMAVDARRDPVTRTGALARVGGQLGINPETSRNWVTQVEVGKGDRPGITTEESRRIAELERENRELRRANAVLKSAWAVFAAELDRPQR